MGTQAWGSLAIMLHWVVAATIIVLFALGLWMTGLDYYDPWYRQGPDIHRSIGSLLLVAIVLRMAWRLIDTKPQSLPNHQRWEVVTAHIAHGLLYLLPLSLIVTGYLISTADGRAVSVFDWFQIPALYTGMEQQEEVM